MAKLINVLSSLDGVQVATHQVQLKVKDGTTASIKAGMLVIRDGSNAGYVKAAADACDTDSLILGVANSDSTETSTAVGYVTVEAAPVMVVRMKAKTPANLTQALCLTNRYILDVTSGSYTIDTATTTKGIFTIVSFDNTTDGNCIATFSTNGW